MLLETLVDRTKAQNWVYTQKTVQEPYKTETTQKTGINLNNWIFSLTTYLKTVILTAKWMLNTLFQKYDANCQIMTLATCKTNPHTEGLRSNI
jgi:hypothetical protein